MNKPWFDKTPKGVLDAERRDGGPRAAFRRPRMKTGMSLFSQSHPHRHYPFFNALSDEQVCPWRFIGKRREGRLPRLIDRHMKITR